MQLRRIRAKHLTLIEVMVVLFLVTLAAGVVGVNVLKAVQQERYSASVRRVVDRVQMAQDLMLLSSTDQVGLDTTLRFFVDGGNWWCRLGFEGTLPERRLDLFQTSIKLEGIEEIEWQGESLRDTLTLHFSALDWHFPFGQLRLTAQGGQSRWIACGGMAQRYHSVSVAPAVELRADLTREGQLLYPARLREES